MGTWSPQLDGNDFFLDVYAAFEELHQSGKSPQECTNEVMLEFLELSWDDVMDDEDHEAEEIEHLNATDDNDIIEFFLAIAKAQLDINALHPYIYQTARLIIETKTSLRLLKALDADEAF